ncbi:MAG: hypothetical protein H7X79_10575 [Sporomusaceae bacterium]|nr:hypothetical protein [Sporomusaceae bacterium]
MESLVGFVNVLAPVFSCCHEQREQDELMGYLNKYLHLPQCQSFIVNHVRNLKSGNTEELQQIGQELMQRGQFDLAKQINTLVSREGGISEELYTRLESYFKSADFYKDVENNLIGFTRKI